MVNQGLRLASWEGWLGKPNSTDDNKKEQFGLPIRISGPDARDGGRPTSVHRLPRAIHPQKSMKRHRRHAGALP